MKRASFQWAFLGWFTTNYPRTAKALVIVLGLLIGMYASAVKK